MFKALFDFKFQFVGLIKMYAKCMQHVRESTEPSFLQGVRTLLSASNLVGAWTKEFQKPWKIKASGIFLFEKMYAGSLVKEEILNIEVLMRLWYNPDTGN